MVYVIQETNEHGGGARTETFWRGMPHPWVQTPKHRVNGGKLINDGKSLNLLN